MEVKTERRSGIELVKVLAIFLIVISHVVQSLEGDDQYIPYGDHMLELKHATRDLQIFILIVLRYSGALGNSIFFICSAWFLLDSRSVKHQKILTIVLEMWSISIMILGIACLIKGEGIHFKLVMKSFFPFISGANWYVGCYVLFYALHPLLNQCIDSLKQTELLKYATVSGVLYCGCNYIHPSFYSSSLILWVTIYFIIAYIKQYLPGLCDSIKMNTALLILGGAGNFLMILVTNILGLHISFWEDRLLFWNKNCSPFLLLTAFALFQIGRNVYFQSSSVNRISALSLLIYIIHENVLVRTYLRSYLWQRIYTVFGYKHILFWALLFATAVFIVSLILSILFQKTIQRLILYILPGLSVWLDRLYKKYESYITRQS